MREPITGQAPCAGVPSSADDFVETALARAGPAVDVPLAHRRLGMRDAGIHDGNLACVDRSLTPSYGSVVDATVDGKMSIKRIDRRRQPHAPRRSCEHAFDPNSPMCR